MTTALMKTPLRQVASVKQLLMNENARDHLAMVAAKHMNPERMMRVVANAIRTTPQLSDCEPMSFLGALMHCASMGLEPNTPLGHAYLIPFRNSAKNITEVQVVIGYKGFIDLARRSGQLASIHGDVVYSDDEVWTHEYGSNQHLRHRPGPRKGKRLGAYCHVKLNLGDGITAEGHRFMTMDEIIAHRNQHSQGWKTAVKFKKTATSPWNEENPQFEAMAIKTVVRALANRGELPMTIEFMDAMMTDESRADYRGFAMAPDGGLQIEGSAGDEPERDQADNGPTMIEGDKSFDRATEATRREPAETPREDRRPATKQAAAVPKEPETKTAAADPVEVVDEDTGEVIAAGRDDGPDEEQFTRVADMIKSDIADGMARSDIEDMYGPQISAIATHFPDLKASIDAAFAAADQ